jgi:hypothetical protein
VTGHCFIGEAKSLYERVLKSRYGEPAGCTPAEIAGVERHFGHAFPAAYRQYLLWMGKDEHGIFGGSGWFLADIIKNTSNLDELLQENGIAFEHPGKPLCFFSHQGYMASWFYLPAASDDPECFLFGEGRQAGQIEHIKTFSEFLLTDMTGLARI